MRNASFRSQNASASLQIPLSAIPGRTSKLKIESLSSELSCLKTDAKSSTLNTLINPMGGLPVIGCATFTWVDDAIGAEYVPLAGTVTSEETGFVDVPMRVSIKFCLSLGLTGLGLMVTLRYVSAREP